MRKGCRLLRWLLRVRLDTQGRCQLHVVCRCIDELKCKADQLYIHDYVQKVLTIHLILYRVPLGYSQ